MQGANVQYPLIRKLISSIWFWWLVTTILYGVGWRAISFPDPFNGGGDYHLAVGSVFAYVVGFVGLFVPYGVSSVGLFLVSPMSWASLIVFVLLVIGIDMSLNKRNMPFWKRVLADFLALLVITMAVDFIRGTPFFSWFIFMSGFRFPSNLS